MTMRVILMTAAMLIAVPVQGQTQESDGTVPAPSVGVVVSRPRVDTKSAVSMMMDYPIASLKAREQGEVTLAMCVSAEGLVSDPKLLKSSGYPRLDESTLKQALRLRFTPAKDAAGNPVAMCSPPYEMSWVWSLPGL